ncbi:hypothetical protein PR243_00915 [Metamycoplasma hyosynoviae]|uniref:hypothetical protein n=1 Tax=Metamycoplasma hyosynoviae TaxID=29559 RepID=UPI00235A16D3|nr:hypothetical protein [Metamycoplasma hyosynoviae]MDC8937142.1 hypothetical protein [Metamycoplasma hyosynoviae]
MEKYKVGQIIKAQVKKVWRNVVYLYTADNKKCYLTIKEISDYKVADIEKLFKINSIKQLQIIDIDPLGDLIVSFKRIHPKELRNPFKYKLETENNNFEQLLDFVMKGIRYGK